MKTTFDTQLVPKEARFEYWHDVVCSQFVLADSMNKCVQNFNAEITSRSLGKLLISEMSAPTHTWNRSQRHIRKDDQEHYILSLISSGKGRLEQCGRVLDQKAGDIALYDTALPFQYALDAKFLVVKIPRKFLDARAPHAREHLAENLSAVGNLPSLLANLARSCLDMQLTESAEAIVGDRMSESITDMLLAVLDLYHEEHGGYGGGYDSLEKIKSYALANLGNSQLTPLQLADAGHVSIRTLNRIFGRMGTTPMRWVQQERLRLSESYMREGSVRSVTETAFLVGFNDLGHFSRSFKQMFGYTPEQVLFRR